MVGRRLVIPGREIELAFTTSGGPGGQHANRSSTRVELAWNVERSAVLSPEQRRLICAYLKGRIDSSGTLRLASDTHRSQLRNREDVIERLATLIGRALVPRRTRRATKPSRAVREKRLTAKKRRGETKRRRRSVDE